MVKNGGRGCDEEQEEQEELGAGLQLAQRHRKIQAGSFKGRCVFEPEAAHPGRVGQAALTFTTTGSLGHESRITCVLPAHGWSMPEAPNAMLRLRSNDATLPLKASWTAATRVIEFTLPPDRVVPAESAVVIVLAGVATPEHATPQAEATVTAFEKLVVRSTVPPSTRGGQIIDGPRAFTIPKIVPGQIGGERRWLPFNCCPGAISDVSVSFTAAGKLPTGGIVRLELPHDGWDMDDVPVVGLKTGMATRAILPAAWDRSQHVLEVVLCQESEPISMDMRVTLVVDQVKNPEKESMHLGESRVAGRITTLSSSGGVIDGPTKLDIASISQLRDCDFTLIKSELDKELASSDRPDALPLSKLPDLFRRAGLNLSGELYQRLVLDALPPQFVAEPSTSDQEAKPADAAEISDTWVLKAEVLSVFAMTFAPAYKYGQELRVACSRGQTELVQELICRGCDPSSADGTGWSALHYAAEYGQLALIDLLASLLSQQQDDCSGFTLPINARDVSGWTPLLCAASNGYSAVVERLIALGADLSIPTTGGRTALHWACIRGMAETTRVLLQHGISVDLQDRNGWTAMHCAVLHGNSPCVDILVEHGAAQDIKDKLSYQPVYYRSADPLLMR